MFTSSVGFGKENKRGSTGDSGLVYFYDYLEERCKPGINKGVLQRLWSILKTENVYDSTRFMKSYPQFFSLVCVRGK